MPESPHDAEQAWAVWHPTPESRGCEFPFTSCADEHEGFTAGFAAATSQGLADVAELRTEVEIATLRKAASLVQCGDYKCYDRQDCGASVAAKTLDDKADELEAAAGKKTTVPPTQGAKDE